MHKLIRISAALLAALTLLVACAKEDAQQTTVAAEEENNPAVTDTRSLKAIADGMLSAIDAELPTLVESEVSDDRFAYYFGVERPQGVSEVYVTEPMMSAIPFGIALLRLEDSAGAAALAKEMKQGINPARWVCVTASYVETAVRGNVILLILDNEQSRGDALLSAFCAGK